MTKKKPARKRQPQNKTGLGLPPPVVDRRALERGISDITRLLNEQKFESIDEANAFIQNLLGSGGLPPKSAAQTPVEQAQDIMYNAWDASSRTQRIKLAKQALTISEDCADAYVLLAETSAETLEGAMQLY